MEHPQARWFVSNMKPLISEIQDVDTLQELGRASVQIVHDLKNQLNGLKLYATFLRKRMEKSERPADEQETILKLISGLERAAADMTALVRYSRPVELRRQPHVDLVKILNAISTADPQGSASVRLEPTLDSLEGEFDTAAITEAFKIITAGAINLRRPEDNDALLVYLRREETEGASVAVVEWRGVRSLDGVDPFHSFVGSDALRMSLAAKIIAAHGGEAGPDAGLLRVRLPVKQRAEG
jgi:light-regulated signal transduction histidine kinase (bacteriophytochrome)